MNKIDGICFDLLLKSMVELHSNNLSVKLVSVFCFFKLIFDVFNDF